MIKYGDVCCENHYKVLLTYIFFFLSYIGNMAKKVTLLDGGFSTQLQKYVEEPLEGDPLWTAKLLVKCPEKCKLVHRDFVLGKINLFTYHIKFPY